jgi:hypothetical protein
MRRYKRGGLCALILCALALSAWAQQKKSGEEMENQVRRAGFSYYATTVFGDADGHLKVTRMPLYAVRDGAGAFRDEKQTRALLAKFADNLKAANVSGEDRSRMMSNMIAIFDTASIQFIGANTASLTFLVRRGKDPKTGDSLGTLILHRKENQWQVIAEFTDSAPVPPDSLRDVPIPETE